MKQKVIPLSFSLTLLLVTIGLVAGEKTQRYLRLNFIKETRTVEEENLVSGNKSFISIDKPKSYVNCDTNRKIRFVGHVRYRDGEVAKSFPILDSATMKVWYTDQKGIFDFKMPGNCSFGVHTLLKRVGTVYYIQPKFPEYAEDIIIDDSAYLVKIAETFPRQVIEKALLGQRDSALVSSKEGTCFTGLIPAELSEFRIYGLDEVGKNYFPASDYDEFFEIDIPQRTKFRVFAYTNQPGHKIHLFKAIIAAQNKQLIHERANKACTPIIFESIGEYFHKQLESENFLTPILEGK